MDELVEDLDGRAVGDEVVGVEVEVVVGALEDVEEEEGEAGADDLGQD